MSSDERTLSDAERQELLKHAGAAIEAGLAGRHVDGATASGSSPALQRIAACFVTLRRFGRLRGCIGSLEATRPLANDVAQNAWRAAFADPRFTPLSRDELEDLEVQVSVVSSLEALEVRNDTELIAELRPGRDGAVLALGSRHGTFLPAVWESLPEPSRFVQELRRKSGIRSGGWAEGLQAFRYSVESFAGPVSTAVPGARSAESTRERGFTADRLRSRG
jgi:AmmeMemoRadiSam system protein A